jgi:hypothetical protein
VIRWPPWSNACRHAWATLACMRCAAVAEHRPENASRPVKPALPAGEKKQRSCLLLQIYRRKRLAPVPCGFWPDRWPCAKWPVGRSVEAPCACLPGRSASKVAGGMPASRMRLAMCVATTLLPFRCETNGYGFFVAGQGGFCTACLPETARFNWCFGDHPFYTVLFLQIDRFSRSLSMEYPLAGLLPDGTSDRSARNRCPARGDLSPYRDAQELILSAADPYPFRRVSTACSTYLEWHFASEERVARQVGVDFADHASASMTRTCMRCKGVRRRA